MKKKLLTLAFTLVLASTALAQGGVPTGGIKQCPPNTVCTQSVSVPWYVDFVGFVLSIV